MDMRPEFSYTLCQAFKFYYIIIITIIIICIKHERINYLDLKIKQYMPGTD